MKYEVKSEEDERRMKREELLEELERMGVLVSDWRVLVSCWSERKKRVKLPWCGVVLEGKCKSIRRNGGLYTQCGVSLSISEIESEYCEGCVEEKMKNGELKYGTVYDRMKVGIEEYRDEKGNKVVRYSQIMKKEKISKEEVLEEGIRMGIEVPLCHFEENEGKRGRPRKEKSVKEEVEKRKRGRPKKEKEVVWNSAGEELIASLLSERREVCEGVEVCEGGEVCEVCEGVEGGLLEEEEETSVMKCEIGGKTYLKSDDNVLYDLKTHDAVGVWNEERNEIEELPDEEE